MVSPFPLVARRRLNRAIHAIPGAPLLYITNPKVACSNIKWSLVAAFAPAAMDGIRLIHHRPSTPFADGPGLAARVRAPDVTVFSVVRHPRRRFVSAYFNKLHDPRLPAGQNILRMAGLDPADAPHPPKAVLRGLLSVARQDLDPHVAPQVVNLFWGSLPYAHVFRLERIGRAGAALDFGTMRLPILDRSRSGRLGPEDLALFDAEDYAMIDTLYRDDYAAFGYDPDPAAPIEAQVETIPYDPFLLDLMTLGAPLDVARARLGLAPLARLMRPLRGAPADLTFLETGALIDVLQEAGALPGLPPALRQALERQAAATPENAQRLRRALAAPR